LWAELATYQNEQEIPPYTVPEKEIIQFLNTQKCLKKEKKTILKPFGSAIVNMNVKKNVLKNLK